MKLSEQIINVLRSIIGLKKYNCKRVVGTGLYAHCQWEAVFLFNIKTPDTVIEETLLSYNHQFTVLKSNVEFNENSPNEDYCKKISCRVTKYFD